jgi:hypothetical protein
MLQDLPFPIPNQADVTTTLTSRVIDINLHWNDYDWDMFDYFKKNSSQQLLCYKMGEYKLLGLCS